MMADLLESPKCLNMGFHYTRQFSRRNRIKVLGLVDQATEEWSRWYLRMHEADALKEMAEAGYNIIEIHFMYGFGIEGEREEFELTRKMTANAHAAGLKVNGYFQFFSVQQETFFPENPWARDCLQIQADGTPHLYQYDRPALCFTHEKVRQYYLGAIELGLGYCDLDGIRLDNDYFRGCYCERCQVSFRAYLKQTFSPEKARRVFGLACFEGMSLPPDHGVTSDPLWMAMTQFRMRQRQTMMKLLSDKVVSIKPKAILGGNPAVGRMPSELSKIHVYPPDLGETHHLVCAENNLFPGRTGDSIRHQVALYKHGQANGFKVFASHHLYTNTDDTCQVESVVGGAPEGSVRWPETTEECALSLCEALCFGGHPPCTTWGIRMDSTEDKTLYQRPYFLDALRPISDFLTEYSEIYCDAVCDASLGIYMNRESLIADYDNCWFSLQGILQILLANKIPFRFVDRDDDLALEGLDTLIVGNARLVSDEQLKRFAAFAGQGKILLTGEACSFDEYFLRRESDAMSAFLALPSIYSIDGCPEKLGENDIAWRGSNVRGFAMPAKAMGFLDVLRTLCSPMIRVEGNPFIVIDTFVNKLGEHFIHVLNYDNANHADLSIVLPGCAQNVEVLAPTGIGSRRAPKIITRSDATVLSVEALQTYMIVKYEEGRGC